MLRNRCVAIKSKKRIQSFFYSKIPLNTSPSRYFIRFVLLAVLLCHLDHATAANPPKVGTLVVTSRLTASGTGSNDFGGIDGDLVQSRTSDTLNASIWGEARFEVRQMGNKLVIADLITASTYQKISGNINKYGMLCYEFSPCESESLDIPYGVLTKLPRPANGPCVSLSAVQGRPNVYECASDPPSVGCSDPPDWPPPSYGDDPASPGYWEADWLNSFRGVQSRPDGVGESAAFPVCTSVPRRFLDLPLPHERESQRELRPVSQSVFDR